MTGDEKVFGGSNSGYGVAWRDVLAALALPGLLSRGAGQGSTVKCAYEIADKMILESQRVEKVRS